MKALRAYLALALLIAAVPLSFALIWWLTDWYWAMGWALFVLAVIAVVREASLERKESERAEREYRERAVAPAFHQLPERCHEAPDPYRRAA